MVETAPERACGDCSLCCKVYPVFSLNKAAGRWCHHARPGQGCGIHAIRPNECRAFFCAWITMPTLPEAWKPSRSKMVINVGGTSVCIMVDPGAPDAWKRQPYYQDIKTWASQPEMLVMVGVAGDFWVVTPEADIPVGRDVDTAARVETGFVDRDGSRRRYAKVVREGGEELWYYAA